MIDQQQTEASKRADTVTAHSHVFKLSEIAAKPSPSGAESWNFGGGMLTTGEWVRLHESLQPAGAPPSPDHRIDHTELICILSGDAEYSHDGATDRAAPGDILLVARGTDHHLRNVGTVPLRYFVLAIGGDVHA